jgi:hypothetical protein
MYCQNPHYTMHASQIIIIMFYMSKGYDFRHIKYNCIIDNFLVDVINFCFVLIPFYLQTVHVHLANGVNLKKAWRGVLSSTPPNPTGSRPSISVGNKAYKLYLKNCGDTRPQDVSNGPFQGPRYIGPASTSNCFTGVKVEVKVKVTMRLTVSQSVCLGVDPNYGTFDHIFFFESYSLVIYGAPSLTRGRVCHVSVLS